MVPFTRNRLWLAIVLLALGLALSGCDAASAPKVGQTAPDLTLPDLDGGTVNLADLRGQVVMLNFWASNCQPCRDEMPDMQKVYAELGDKGVVILAVDQQESAETVRRFADALGLTFPMALDLDGAAGRVYGVQYIPTTYVIDRDGIIRYKKVGQMDEQTIRQYFTSLL